MGVGPGDRVFFARNKLYPKRQRPGRFRSSGIYYENNLSSQDTTELTQWVRQQKVISIRVYKNEILVYDSNYPDEAIWDADAQGGYYSWESYYTLTFSDGKADIFLR